MRTIAISLFALMQAGKELVIERAKEIETPVLINTMPLPVLSEQKQPSWMGEMLLYEWGVTERGTLVY